MHATGVMVWTAIEYVTRISLVRINGNMNAKRHISDISLPAVALYLRGHLNDIS